MKIYRFEAAGAVRLGIESGGLLHDAASLYARAGENTPDVVRAADLKSIAAAPEVFTVFLSEALKNARDLPAAADGRTAFDPAQVRLLAPVPNPGKVICIGLNYMEHAREQGKEPPPRPMLFAKFANAVCATGDRVVIPPITRKVDYEGELAVVIGRGGRRIPRDEARSHVFGYMAAHDVSARDLQKSDGQWLRAKGLDNFLPTGPCLVTPDSLPDPQALRIRSRLNGQIMQDSSTADMIFPVDELIAFISQGITLEPGDIISTGTPQGVGAHRTPPVFLKEGDVVEVEIDGIGMIRNEFAVEE